MEMAVDRSGCSNEGTKAVSDEPAKHLDTKHILILYFADRASWYDFW